MFQSMNEIKYTNTIIFNENQEKKACLIDKTIINFTLIVIFNKACTSGRQEFKRKEIIFFAKKYFFQNGTDLLLSLTSPHEKQELSLETIL